VSGSKTITIDPILEDEIYKSSYNKKELNSDFEQYIVDMIDIDVPNYILDIKVKNIITTTKEIEASIKDSLTRRYTTEQIDSKNHNKSIILYFVFGFIMMASSLIMREHSMEDSIVDILMSEGVVILSWVLIWEAIDKSISYFGEIKQRLKIYKILSTADVIVVEK
jgi:hypothetical protein